MEQEYPLKAYPTQYSREITYDDDVSSYASQHVRIWRASGYAHSLVPGTNYGYAPLDDDRSGQEDLRPRPPPKPSHISPKTQTPSSLSAWWPELVACLFSVGCLVAIVVVLRVHDGRLLGDIRLPASLTLNGIVAALSTLSRTALMVAVGSALSQESWVWFLNNARRPGECRSRLKDFQLSDDASRGAWGSLLFLLLARRRYIAYIGAIAIIISLAFGTFTQQLLSFAEFAVTDKNLEFMPGSLPRAETWQYYNALPTDGVLMTPPFTVRAATYSGILSDDISPINANCATGNCTWPITPSLAVCGACSQSSYERQCSVTECTYTMPSGASYRLVNGGRSWDVGFVVGAVSQGAQYNRSADGRLYLVNFDMLGAPFNTPASGFTNENTAASECALWMCVQSFSARMVNGQLEENVTMEFSDLSLGTENLMDNFFGNVTFAPLPAEMNPDPEVAYNVSSSGAQGFLWLRGLFNGTATLTSKSSRANSDTVEAAWNASANPDPWIKHIARSMTNAIRYDDPNPQPPSRTAVQPAPPRSIYQGIGYQLGVRIRWVWIILPCVCAVLSILCLSLVMFETARSNAAPWKASLLTLIFLEPDQELKQLAANSTTRQHKGLVPDEVINQRAILRKDALGKLSLKIA